MSDDFRDMLEALLAEGVRFVVVGAHAVGLHARPRATGDLDLLVEPTPDNGARAWRALVRFGAPVASLEVRPEDLETPGIVVQVGVEPNRIDLMTTISGVSFEEAWSSREVAEWQGLEIPFLGRAALIANKRATGRLQDLADLEALGEG